MKLASGGSNGKLTWTSAWNVKFGLCVCARTHVYVSVRVCAALIPHPLIDFSRGASINPGLAEVILESLREVDPDLVHNELALLVAPADAPVPGKQMDMIYCMCLRLHPDASCNDGFARLVLATVASCCCAGGCNSYEMPVQW